MTLKCRHKTEYRQTFMHASQTKNLKKADKKILGMTMLLPV